MPKAIEQRLSENPMDSAGVETEALLADIPFRRPIIDDHNPLLSDIHSGEDYRQVRDRIEEHEAANKARDAKIEHQWLAVTEAARRGILGNSEVRRVASRFSSEPLSEALPEKAISEIAEVDERTARLARLAGKTLGKMLELESVPDELLTPDIQNAPALTRKDIAADTLANYRDDDEYRGYALDNIKKNVLERPGVTDAERALVARRYRYARDSKLLGLMAELHDQPIEASTAENGVLSHELPSGTKLVMTAEAFATTPALLDPQKWESRTQLKDRVHVVTIAGQQHIMKERKTSRHTDVKKHGHKDGLTSEQEFAVAREFAQLGTIKQGDIELHWEKPLGYAEFPDGYQFCLFEAEPGLDTERPKNKLTREILNSPEEYREQYEQVARQAKEVYRTRKDLLRGRESEEVIQPKKLALSRAARARRKAQKTQPAPDELTFEEFAELKAHYMIDEATDLLSRTVRGRGYVNSDIDGYGFKVRTDSSERPLLEIVGFDFEYYQKDPKDALRVEQNIHTYNKNGEGARARLYRIAGKRQIMAAASYAMLERMGLNMPPAR